MFISNKEKKDIGEKFDNHKFQIDNLVKHVAEIQVDMGKTDIFNIDDVRESNSKLQKMYWGADKRIKTLEKLINELQIQNEVLTKRIDSRFVYFLELKERVEKLENKKPIENKKSTGRPVGSRNKLVISADKVQAMKEAGVWDDPIKRINSIDQLIQEERERRAQHKREKQREYNRAYKARQQAKKAAQKELL